MDDRERDYDRSCPRRHLVDERAEQHDLGRNSGAVLARIEIEQAQIHLDVTVGRLNTAERQNSFPRTREMRIIIGHSRKFQREIGFDGCV